MSVSGLIFLLIWGLLIVLVLILIWHIDQMKCTIIKADSIVTLLSALYSCFCLLTVDITVSLRECC